MISLQKGALSRVSLRLGAYSSVRTAVYVSKSAPVGRGLRKDPEEYTVSPSGVRYPGDQSTLKPLKSLLGDKYALRDNLLLQVLVHKSFAHAKFPYNEKLSVLGRNLIRLESFRYAAAQPSPESASVNVEGNNFNITNDALELLSATPVISTVCEKAGLVPSLFYKVPQNKDTPVIKAKAVHALIGAISYERGTEAAIEFIHEKLFQGELNIFDIADKMYAH